MTMAPSKKELESQTNKTQNTSSQKPPLADSKAKPKTFYALVVDDEPANRDFLVRLLQQAKMEVEGAGTGHGAIEIAQRLGADLCLIMLDRQLPDASGIEVLPQLREIAPNAKIVMATMYDQRSMIREAFETGCNAFLVKPHGFMEIYKLVSSALAKEGNLDCLDNLIFDQYGRRSNK